MFRSVVLLALLLPATSCGSEDDDDADDSGGASPSDDADGDGVSSADGDCDDADPSRHPGAPEGCDGLDTDCDGTVDDDGVSVVGGAAFDDLVDALAAAPAGATVTVCPGTHRGEFVIQRDVEVVAAEGPSRTTIEAEDEASVIVIEAGEATIDGFTIRGGAGTWTGEFLGGGGLYVNSGAALTLQDSVVEDNEAEYGGGLFCAGDVSVADSDFADNSAEISGGAIFALETDVDLSNVTIEENVAESGGGGIPAERASVV